MKRALSSVFVMLALAGCGHKEASATAPGTVSHANLDLRDDGNGYVTGRVTGKQPDCTIGACYLTVASNAREVRIIYGTSTAPCDAGSIGDGVQIGQIVKAYGRYSRDGEDGIVDVCTGGGGFLERKDAEK